MPETRIEMAQRHVAEGRHIVDRQRALIALKLAHGHATTEAEALLRQFEKSLALFEYDLALLKIA